MSGVRRLLVVLCVVAGLLVLGLPSAGALSVPGASSSSGGVTGVSQTGSAPPPLPPSPASDGPDSDGPLAPMNDPDTGSQAADQAAVSAASGQAESSGKPVMVAALTTATSVTTAEPDGEVTVTQTVLPVRVRQGKSWVPVSTALRSAGGMLAPAAVPGDRVAFSEGGSGPLAVIAAGGTSLSLSWPGRVPVPAVSGSSATYAGILPGVNLILTATSAQAGGFSSVIEVMSAAAARDPRLARLELAVHAKGVRLREAPGGGLAASGPRGAGAYAAAPPVMWDSSSMPPAAAGGVKAAAARLARAVGASLAPPGLAGPRSTFAGPSRGARLARVGTGVSAGGGTLALVPDAALLSSKSTRFPVFIDPSFTWSTNDNGKRMHYDEVQSACPTASHYDTTDTTDYWSLGVGYDGFGDDCNGANGYAYSYYQMSVPSAIWGGYIDSAVINAQEAYTASCSASAPVTLSRTGAINSGTDWGNKPGVVSDVVTPTVGPGPADSCNTEFDTNSSDWKGVGFTATSLIAAAAKGDWTNFTFRLWENGDSNDVDWKRFGKNPYLQVTYEQRPNQPSGLQISTSGAGSDCTASPFPWVGKLSSGGTTMSAVVSSKTGDQLEGIFQYQKGTGSGSTWTTVDSTSTAITSGKKAMAVIPASFTNGQPDGTEVTWRVEAYNGAPSPAPAYSPWSALCHFYADPSDPPAPTVTAGFTTDPAAGAQVSFTIKSNDPSTDPASEFVWELDKAPSSSSPSSAQVIGLTSGQTSATVKVKVPGPGPHALYAYARDAAGNDSDWSGPSDPASFSATADPDVTYPSFADALAAGLPFDNTMISTSASVSGSNVDGDGNGNSISEAELKAAGWQPGGTVTIDGAQFTLPGFGAGSTDNILAANQTIDLPSGSQGTSLVFLATSSNGDAASPDAGTLEQDQGNAQSAGATLVTAAPYIPDGSAVTGYECDTAGTGEGDCALPTGAVTYASGVQQSYGLTVPNWVSGPTPSAAMVLPDRLSPTTVLTGQQSKIYAFAVPLDPGVPVTSVTLPDIGQILSAGGISYPALHIFGIAVAGTTTATPGSTVPLDPGQTWTGAWASPTEGAYAPQAGSTFSNQTFRIALQASAGGSALRLRLSDDLGWLAGASGKPLDIGAVTVAGEGTGPSVTGTVTQATFGAGNSDTVTIPEGGDAYTNPVPITVTPGESLTVSVYLANGSSGAHPAVKYLVQHSMCSACTEYVAPAGTGNQTANTDGTPFTGTGTVEGQFTDILTGVDVQTSGTPTVPVLGDGLTDPLGADTTAPLQGARVSDDLASGLQSAAGAGNQPAFGVIGEGIQSNQILTDTDTSATGTGGPSALTRLARDILADPGVGTVVVDEGLEDLLQAGNSPDIETSLIDNGYSELASLLNEWGITVIFATMTPCSGYAGSGSQTPEDACTTGTAPTVETSRFDINYSYLMAEWGNVIPFPGLPAGIVAVDFDSAVSASPYSGGNTADNPVDALAPADNAGDHVNLTSAGYAAVTAAIPLSDLVPAAPPGYGS